MAPAREAGAAFVLAVIMAAGGGPAARAGTALEAAPAGGDLDARQAPWSMLRRLALEAGRQPPVDEPLAAGQLRRLLADLAQADGPVREDAAERARLAALAADSLRPAGLRLGGRVLAGFTERGALVPGESGLAWGPGWNLAAEGAAQASRGPWWAALTLRARGRPGWGHGPADDAAGEALDWPGWDPATGPGQQRRAQGLGRGVDLDLVRGIVGLEAGKWALDLGWEPRRHGPGLAAALVLDRDGPSFPALTARRVAPFRWRGPLRPLAPESLLLRAGLLSERTVSAAGEPGGLRADRPWFFQWLVRWRVTDWLRVGGTHAAVAAARDGTLWPDLLRINFPTAGVTWREQSRGPDTDRLFAAQVELRWRRAPWRLLPAAAGRAWWEYAGTDFLPRGPGGIFPEIAAPASVAGLELVDPRWDLGLEYAETLHPLVLWYANGSFPGGYEQQGWLLGTGLGGAGERWSGLVRWRPGGAGGAWYGEFALSRTAWGHEGLAPGLARERAACLSVGSLRGGAPGPWRARCEWRRSEALPAPADAAGDPGSRRRWWTLALERSF